MLRRVCLGTEEHSLWGSTKGGGQGAGWGSMCVVPGSSAQEVVRSPGRAKT